MLTSTVTVAVTSTMLTFTVMDMANGNGAVNIQLGTVE